MRFEEAELVIYDTNGNDYRINLNDTETKVVLKALGIRPNTNGQISAYGTKTLQNILMGKINPFKLTEIEQ